MFHIGSIAGETEDVNSMSVFETISSLLSLERAKCIQYRRGHQNKWSAWMKHTPAIEDEKENDAAA